MGYAIAIIFVLMIFSTVVRFSRRLLYDGYMLSVSDADFKAQAVKLAGELAAPEKSGKGVDISAFKGVIGSAYGIIRRKAARGETLYGYERWLYDNNFIIRRRLSSGAYDAFYKLPHVDGVPRVVTLARRVLSLSGGKLDNARLRLAVDELNKTTPLHINEFYALPDALAFALLERIALISKRCVYYRRLFRLAVRAKNVAKRYAKSNIYVYYTIKSNPKLADRLKSYLEQSGRGYDNIDYTFSALIIENNLQTEALIGSLFALKGECNVALLPVEVLDRDALFKNMSAATRRLYLNEVSEQSTKLNVDEVTFCRKLLEYGAVANLHFGDALFDYKRGLTANVTRGINVNVEKAKSTREQWYIAANIGITALLTAGVGFVLAYFSSVWWLLLLPFVFTALLPTASHLTDLIVRALVSARPLCSMSYTSVPDDAPVTVVVPVYVSDLEELKDASEHIEVLAAGNGGSNINFVLLLDFKSSDRETDEADEVQIEYLKRRNDRDDIIALVRKRTLVRGRYSGRERKRGAIEDFNALLMENKVDNFVFLSKMPAKPKFIVVLDADNTLAPGGVLRAVNTFLHPQNGGFDLLAFDCKINLFSLKTPYSMRFSRDGGLVDYPNYGNFFYNLLGKGIFCGKGIYRLDTFYNKLHGRLPENKVLSHDVLEGGILDTGEAGEAVYEDAPQSFVSDCIRLTRWQRGDVQLLPFLSGDVKLSAVNKLLIFKNAVGVLSPFCIFALLVTALFCGEVFLALAGALCLCLSFAVNELCFITRLISKTRPRYVLLDMLSALSSFIGEVATLPQRAYYGLKVFATTVYRMCTGGNLLEWKTFASGQKGSDGRAFARLVAAPLVIVSVICGLSFLTPFYGFTLLYAALCGAWYAIICFEGKVPKEKAVANDDLMKSARATYAYFEDVEEGSLPPDHVTVEPDSSAANYTSPTNIGFWLLSHVCAVELGLITEKEGERRVLSALNTVVTLKRWNGLFYNWYDVSSKGVVGKRYISSVDNGNLAACLIVIK